METTIWGLGFRAKGLWLWLRDSGQDVRRGVRQDSGCIV